MLTSILLNPAVNRLVAELDNTSSMSSIVMRDLVDNAGRITQAYRRDAHDGRERLIEENLTTVIWGFGIRYLKNLFDRTVGWMAGRGLGGVLHPALDMTLLEKGPQQLTPQVIERYIADNPALKAHLHDVVSNRKNLVNAYKSANVAKFVLATFIPIALIAFGIPTFNQWLTRKKLKEGENQAKAPHFQALYPFDTRGRLQAPKVFQVFDADPGKPGMQSRIYFGGGLMNGVYGLLQNERINTLLVDGTISTGRTYKGRNLYERLEVLFQEACIIYFLFFAQTPIQKAIQNAFDKMSGIRTAMPFQGLKALLDGYGKSPDKLDESLRQVQKGLGEFVSLKGLSREETGKILAAFEEKVVPEARAYVAKSKQGNVLFDLARACGYLPTRKTASGGVTIDITRKIQTEKIYALGRQLDELVSARPLAGVSLEKLLKRSISGKFGAFILAAGLCSAFLGLVIPRLKQRITYWLTGSEQFPGTLHAGERQGLFTTADA